MTISAKARHTIILVLLGLLVHCFLFWHYGLRNLFDATAYLNRADFLIAEGRLEDSSGLFYIVPVGLIALFRLVFPSQILPYLIFQCVVFVLAAIALYKASSRVFNSPLSGLLSGMILLLWLDNVHWNTVPMTESLFVSVTCFIFFLLTHFHGTWRQYVYLCLLLMIAFFTRPTSILIIVGSIFFLIVYHWDFIKRKPSLKYGLLAGLLVAAWMSATLMFTFWDFTDQYMKGNIITYIDIVAGDSLYQEALRLDASQLRLADEAESPILKVIYFVVYNPMYFLKSGSMKVWYLLSSVRPYYSNIHNIFSLTWVSFIYALTFLGWKRIPELSTKVLVASIVLLNCLLVSISTIDWDNRFYIPMEPGIVILAGGGAAYVVEKIKNLLLR